MKPTVEELMAYAKAQGFAEDFLNYPRAFIDYWIDRAWGDGTVDAEITARYEAAKEDHKQLVKTRLKVCA